MNNYNIQNYIRYKDDVKASMPIDKDWSEYSRDELIIKFMPLVENLSRKFSTSTQASGIMDITDLIQDGNVGLIKAIDKLDWEQLNKSENIEKTLKSFLSKRIKGAIRRAIDINRGSIRIPEYKLAEIRNNKNPFSDIVRMFFNSIFTSLDEPQQTDSLEDGYEMHLLDDSAEYNVDMLNSYLLSVMEKYLIGKEYDIIRLSYGLDCPKMSAKEIAIMLNITGQSSGVRVSQMKKEGIDRIIRSLDETQVADLLEIRY
jgi:RNA polymerase sigma factor (sigma-70 family)